MPIGVVNDSEFELEQDRLNSVPLTGTVVNDTKNVGRGKGNPNVPSILREVIGETSVTEGRQASIELAKQFGISHQSADAYSNGATSLATYNKPDENIQAKLSKARNNIRIKAKSRLHAALDHITDEKLSESKARDLAGIAKDMSGIMTDMSPDTNTDLNGALRPQIIIYAPQIRASESYETIEVRE